MNFVPFQEWLAYKQMLYWVFVSIGLFSYLVLQSRRNIVIVPRLVTISLAILCIYLLGNFPDFTNSGSDKYNYYMEAKDMSDWYEISRVNDIGFTLLTWLTVRFLPFDLYFYILAAVYVGGVFMFCQSLSKRYVWIMFVAMLLNFQFVSYGTNTIRAGLASSFVLMAIACRNNKKICWLLLAVAVSMHKSWLLPVCCYLLSRYKDCTKAYFRIWICSIPISAIAGGFFQNVFALFIGDDRASYLTTDTIGTAYKVGFRIDFILYSCAPIVLGYYYIYKRNFRDVFYKNLYNMYILANTFWILVIRANFSDRFAYLSWFVYSAVLLYPLLVCPNIVAKRKKWIACIILCLTAFYAYI